MSLCSLCLELLGNGAVSCMAGPHQFCRSCFTRYVAAECDVLNGRAWPYITCPYVGKGQCESHAFDDDFIARNVDQATSSKYADVKKRRNVVEKRRAPTTLDDYRTEVVEMLNPTCPRCQIAFIDFHGCCSLSCRLCACSFCAYCLEPQTNVYNHIKSCSYRTLDDWRRGQLHSARARIVALLTPLPTNDRRKVLDSCLVYFKDLNLDVTTLKRALGL